MQPIERRHRPNKVLERCGFPANQSIYGGDVHDQYGNGVFADGTNIHVID